RFPRDWSSDVCSSDLRAAPEAAGAGDAPALPATCALEGSVFTAGATVQWLRDGLGVIRDAAEVERLAASVPDSGGVCFVPALTEIGRASGRERTRLSA